MHGDAYPIAPHRWADCPRRWAWRAGRGVWYGMRLPGPLPDGVPGKTAAGFANAV